MDMELEGARRSRAGGFHISRAHIAASWLDLKQKASMRRAANLGQCRVVIRTT